MNSQRLNRWEKGLGTLLVAAFLGWSPGWTGSEAGAGEAGKDQTVFATVGEEVITVGHFRDVLQQGMRQKFYHGKVPPAEFVKYQREVADQMVDRILLQKEAGRRGLTPDEAEIKKTIAQYDQRYAASKRWRESREQMVGPLTRELEGQSLLQRLEKQVREVPKSSEEDARAFYAANPDKFTQPMRRKLSLILLRVDPGGGTEAWESAKKEAAGLLVKLKGGADFQELARIHSGDRSAESGGQMEEVHQGALAPSAEEGVGRLKIGEITDPPVLVLEGVAIFRLDEVFPPRKVAFEEAAGRAAKLREQERSDQAWNGLRKSLRQKDAVKINEQHYLKPEEKDALLGVKGATQ